MRGFAAAFYKDMKLMMNGTGIFTLLFTLMLVPVFLFGTRDLSAEQVVRPFPVAVRDLDKTFMSRSLVSQLKEIELFAEIRQADENEPDRAALDAGCAAVLTIPKDFFYAMYSAADCPVDITLNENRPLEAAFVRSIFTSVLSIITADQAALRGAYRFVYGTPDDGQMSRIHEEASKDIFLDALGRQNVFTTEITASDLAGVMRRRLAAVLLPMLSVLFAAAAFSTLPQERDMGVISRLSALGTSGFAFRISKVICAAVWAVPLTAVLYVLSGVNRTGLFALLTLFVFFSSFCTVRAIVSWVPDESAAKRCCNLYLLLSLFFSGILLTAGTLKAPFGALQNLFPGRFVYAALNAAAQQESTKSVIMRMLPVAVTGLVALALAGAGVFFAARNGKRKGEARRLRAEGLPADSRPQGAAVRFARLIPLKTAVYAGGPVSLCFICLTAFLCGLSASASPLLVAGSVTVAVSDGDNTPASRALLKALRETDTAYLRLIETGAADGAAALTDGRAEGFLVIPRGYAEAVLGDGSIALEYNGYAAAFSAQGVREIIAGEVASQRAYARARTEAGTLRGAPLTDEEARTLLSLIEEEAASLPAMYRLSGLDGAKAKDPFSPERTGYLSLVLVLLLMTIAAYTGRRDAVAVEKRLAVTRTGRWLTYGADIVAVCLTGLLAGVCFLLPGGMTSGRELCAVILLVICVGAFSLMITRLTAQAGRVDALAPLLSLFICLLGGCFLDLSALSGTVSRFMMLSPAGAALMASGGSNAAFFVLVLESALFLLLGMRRRG
ncbi:MAG: ABC transporter permease [Lachnospiraceae bacterium]|nr:ABC transporter permease [Lachnospiraceae bacterium]